MKSKYHAPPCPLCSGDDIDPFYEDENRTYLNCSNCKLVFVPQCHWLSAEDEKATYDRHENDPQDQGYRQFLSRLSTPLMARLEARQKGLDFGCGPGPTLSILLEAHGQQLDLYDPIYDNDPFGCTYLLPPVNPFVMKELATRIRQILDYPTETT